MPDPSHRISIVDDLREMLGESAVLTGSDVSGRQASWLSNDPMQALAIVRPESTAEVSAVLSACHATGQTVVPLGGNTNLVHGTETRPNDIMLSLERMNAIEETDADGATMIVQAGVPLQRAQDEAERQGMQFALDFGARGSATIGGAISTNAGGNAVIRYGMMREQVLGLEVVTADGTVLSSMNRMLKNNAGYDLKQLFVGTEGTLGIVTRAVLRLRAAMPSQNTALLAVDGYDNVIRILRHLDASLGGTLSAFEVLWKDFYDLVVAEREVHAAPLSAGHEFYILVEARGGDQSADAARFEAVLEDLFTNGWVGDATFAQSGAQRNALWAIRDDIDGLVDALKPAMAFDVSLPIPAADDYQRAVHTGLRAEFGDAYRGSTFGHLGDSNIHFMLTIGSTEHDAQHRAMEIVYEALKPHRGSVSAEHGIGLEKRDYLDVSRHPEEIALMRTLKTALDPRGILNPGKVFE